MRKRLSPKTRPKGKEPSFTHDLARLLPRQAPWQIHAMSKILQSFSRHGLTSDQLGQIMGFIVERATRTSQRPRLGEITMRFDFLKFEGIPAIIPPLYGVFSKHTFEQNKPRWKMYAEADKKIIEKYHGKMPDKNLAALKLNWKNWLQNYYGAYGRYPTPKQIERFADFLAGFIQENPENLTAETYAQYRRNWRIQARKKR